MARILSYVLHPVFMPVFGLVILLNSGTYISILNKDLIKVTYMIVGTFTIVLPLGLLPVYMYLKMIKNIQMNERRERLFPYLITFISFYVAHILIKKLLENSFISAFLFSAVMTVLVLLIISYFWKISSHMAGIGGLIGLILSLTFSLKTDLMYYLIIVVFLSGLLGTSRMKLNAHNLAQIYGGFFVGMITVFSICLVYS